jgi:hypothetical protein
MEIKAKKSETAKASQRMGRSLEGIANPSTD